MYHLKCEEILTT